MMERVIWDTGVNVRVKLLKTTKRNIYINDPSGRKSGSDSDHQRPYYQLFELESLPLLQLEIILADGATSLEIV